MQPECTYANIHNYFSFGAVNRCEFVNLYCQGNTSHIDTLSLYYCTLSENNVLMTLISIPWLFFCFYTLSSTAERYLEPSLSSAAKVLGFSEALAGVTLIALANGIPDVISAFVAGRSQHQGGTDLAFGALFGASIFTTTIVLARVVRQCKSLTFPSKNMIRDCGFYLLAELYLLYLGTLKTIDKAHVIGFVSIYGMFIVTVAIQEYRFKKHKVDGEEVLLSKRQKKMLSSEMELSARAHSQQQLHMPHIENKLSASVQGGLPPALDHSSIFRPERGQTDSVLVLDVAEEWKGSQNPFFQCIGSTVLILQKIWTVIEFPFNIARDWTIPLIDEQNFSLLRLVLYPLLGGIVALWETRLVQKHYKDIAFWTTYLYGSIASGILLWLIGRVPRYIPILKKVLLLFAVFMGAIWLNMVADLLMDLLTLFKVASGLPANFIGLTVLAWGNSLNDFFVDVALAKNGRGVMAVSGIMAGQFFNLQIGFGLLMYMRVGKVAIRVYGDSIYSHINLLLVAFSMLSIVCTLTYGWIKKFVISKRYGYFLYLIYFAFFITIGSLMYAEFS